MDLAPIKPFGDTLARHKVPFSRQTTKTIQLNLGKLCNQACQHCHVEAGPKRTEIMDLKTIDKLLNLFQNSPQIKTIDLTGGAPELNPNFKYLVTEAKNLGLDVIDRCNLTVLFEPGQESTAEFLATNKIRVVASLPCYQKENVEKQRGYGVFDKSIKALKLLNKLGYGVTPDLELSLVYNPLGATLPPSQESLERAYKKELHELFDIEFSHLYTITNMPIKRFLQQLEREQKYQQYMHLLLESFNPAVAESVMCRNLVSVSWDGELFDCDFNQMLELPLIGSKKDIWSLRSFNELESSPIAVGNHCYGCTAGAGSSCSGSLI